MSPEQLSRSTANLQFFRGNKLVLAKPNVRPVLAIASGIGNVVFGNLLWLFGMALKSTMANIYAHSIGIDFGDKVDDIIETLIFLNLLILVN